MNQCKSCEAECFDTLCDSCSQKLHNKAISRGREDTFVSERRVITYQGNDYMFEALYEIEGQGLPRLIEIQAPHLRRLI